MSWRNKRSLIIIRKYVQTIVFFSVLQYLPHLMVWWCVRIVVCRTSARISCAPWFVFPDKGVVWSLHLRLVFHLFKSYFVSCALFFSLFWAKYFAIPWKTIYNWIEFNFPSFLLQQWELLVLSILKWDISSVTPLDFLELLIIRLPIQDNKCPDIKPNKIRKHAQAFISLAARGKWRTILSNNPLSTRLCPKRRANLNCIICSHTQARTTDSIDRSFCSAYLPAILHKCWTTSYLPTTTETISRREYENEILWNIPILFLCSRMRFLLGRLLSIAV